MSICQSYRLLTEAEFEQFLKDSIWAQRLLYGNFFDEEIPENYQSEFPIPDLEGQGRYIDIQKEWQALHFLLTGKVEFENMTEISSPLDMVIWGGHNTPYEATYGYYRYFTRDEILEINSVLDKIEDADLKELHKDKFAQAIDIYANESPDKWDDDYWEFIMGYFNNVKDLFIKAAKENYIVLVSGD